MSYIKDSIYGFVIGDAMGVPIEFKSRESLSNSPITTMTGYGTYFYIPEGVWSDDTSMTLATLDSITKCNGKINYKDITDRFINWIKEADYTATNEVFDIGITTKYALRKYMEENEEPTKCGGNEIGDNGNGSLMRILPITLYTYSKKSSDIETLEIIKNTSSITHRHEQSIMGCYIYTKYIHYILNGNNKIDSYELIKKLDYNIFSNETRKVYSRIIENDIYKEDLNNIKSNGYVVYTLEAVLWTILNTNNYNEAITTAINLGDDTDTVGAITGSIAGLLYGYNSINNEWIDKLKNKELLNEIIEAFEKKIK